MRKRQTAITFIFLFSVVILGALYFFVSQNIDFKDEVSLFHYDPAQIKTVSVEIKNSKSTLMREKGEWRIVEPVNSAADLDTAVGIVSALADFKAERKFVDAENLSEFGLASPSVTVQFVTNHDAHTIQIGTANITGQKYFVQIDKTNPIYLVSDYLISALKKGLGDIREKKVFQFPVSDVSGFEMRSGLGEIQLEKKSFGRWILRGENRAEIANADHVSEMLMALSNLSAI